MRSLICEEPGRLAYNNIAVPAIVPGQTLLRIKRIGICGTDLHAFKGTQPFFSYPRILGHELAAVIEDPGNAEGFVKGEAVTIIPYFICGDCIACRSGKPNCCMRIQVSGVHIDGGMVEWLSVPSYSLVHGQGMDYDSLALIEPLAIGAHAIQRAAITKNEFVLVIGAGPIGLGTMEFARIAGAKVIAMDINEYRLAFCEEKLKINYTVHALRDNVIEKLKEITNGDMPTVIIDATGNLQAINSAFSYMAHGGRYILVGLQKGDISFNHPEFHKREATLLSSRNATRADFEQVMHCMKNGFVDPANYITHRVSFDQAKDAFPYWQVPENHVIKAMVEL